MHAQWVAVHRVYLSGLLFYETQAASQCSVQTMRLCILEDCFRHINVAGLSLHHQTGTRTGKFSRAFTSFRQVMAAHSKD